MEFKQKDERRTFAIAFGVFGAIIAMCLIISAVGNAGAKKQELQATVDQIMIDSKNEDFVNAYVKAYSLYWDDSWASEGEDKWNATRKEIIKQIEEAEKKLQVLLQILLVRIKIGMAVSGTGSVDCPVCTYIAQQVRQYSQAVSIG